MSTDVNQPVAMLTGARQTMMSWAKPIRSFDEVPALYRDACQALFGGRTAFPYVVLAPVMTGSRYKDSEKLLCDLDDTFYVLERVGGRVTTLGYPWRSVRDIEFGNILLYSWITVSGMTTEGAAGASTIVFNMSTRRHFAPFVAKMRPASAGAGEAALRAEQAKFDALASSASFKFMNFAAESLVPGETVIRTVWQDELSKSVAALFGWPLSRPVTLAHLTLLTDKELILIWDDERSEKKSNHRYGGVWRYIPLRHLVSATVTEAGEDLLTLSLGLTAGGRIDRIFAAAARGELEQLQRDLAPLMKRGAAG